MTARRLCLQDTLTRRKQIFKPRSGNRAVRLFTCGPSIYDRPHIGNYRTFLYEDLLQRHLEYLGYDVLRMINFTDVEDKAIERAEEKRTTVSRLTEPIAEEFHRDCRLLRIKLPKGPIPRSSTSVDQAVDLIRKLLAKKIAYRHEDDIFYDPLKFRGFGKLYGLDMTRWPQKKIRFRRDTYEGNRWNRGDFILWKHCRGDSDAEPCWDTELGRGRPSWNVQDPAMISGQLGYRVDISCGGVDNLYRHHDYLIAVMEGVSGKKFSGYWMHGEHVRVNGRKMSKSRGNIVYVQDLLERGYRPHHIRFYLCYGHYRKKLNLDEDRLHLARGKVDTYRQIAAGLEDNPPDGRSGDRAESLVRRLQAEFESRMNDDLDVESAFDSVYGVLAELAQMQARGSLSRADSRRAAGALKKIDTVWRFLD